jgi:hypothetical protein
MWRHGDDAKIWDGEGLTAVDPLPTEPEPPSILKKIPVQNLNTNELLTATTGAQRSPVTPAGAVYRNSAQARKHKNDCGAACAVMLLRVCERDNDTG